MIRTVNDMCGALAAKGFRKDNTHHKMYWLYVNGKKTSIKTFFSHGLKEYGPSLLSQVKKQMKLPTTSEFDQFMDCAMNGDSYVKLMKDRGFVRDQPPATPKAALPPRKRRK